MPSGRGNKGLSRRATPSNPQSNPNDTSVRAVRQELRFISGPMPSAEELARYASIIPGAPERFMQIHERQMDLVEAQTHHRIGLEKCVITGDSRRSWAGLIIGALVAFGGLVWSYNLALHGHDLLAGVGFLTELTSLAGLFVFGTTSRRTERREREQGLSRLAK